MALSRPFLILTIILSLLFSVINAVALPEDEDHRWTRHKTKTITIITTSIQKCPTPKSLGTSSQGSTSISCLSIAGGIIKTVTSSTTFTVTASPLSYTTINDAKTVTVTKTDTVTSVLSGSKGASTMTRPSTVTLTRTATYTTVALASTSTVTVTVPQSGNVILVTVTVSTPAKTVTITQTRPQSDITTTVTAAASIAPPTITVTSDITSTVTATTTLTVTSTATCTNPVINPGFEAGTLAWIDPQVNPGLTLTTQPSSSIPGGAHSGSSAGAFAANNKGAFLPDRPPIIYQPITGIDASCAAAGSYEISVFVKTVSNTCQIRIYNDPLSGASVFSTLLTPGGALPAWQELVAVVPTPLEGALTLAFEARCQTADSVWFDDFTIRPL